MRRARKVFCSVRALCNSALRRVSQRKSPSIVGNFAYGSKAEKAFAATAANIYIPDETFDYLAANSTWNMATVRNSHDIAVLELKEDLPADISIAPLATAALTLGDSLIVNGYGCEAMAEIEIARPQPEPTPAELGPHGSRLKFTAATVDKIFPLVIETGPFTSARKPAFSLCPGDSGGPVYLAGNGGAPGPVVGINSYGRVPGEVEGEEALAAGITRVDSGALYGTWLQKILRGQVNGLKSLTAVPASSCSINGTRAIADLMKWSEYLCLPGSRLSCTFRSVYDLPERAIQGPQACLKANADGTYDDPQSLIPKLKYPKGSPANIAATSGSDRVDSSI